MQIKYIFFLCVLDVFLLMPKMQSCVLKAWGFMYKVMMDSLESP